MKKSKFVSAIFALVATLVFAGYVPCRAEEFSDNPDLYGTWVLESMQYGGEKLVQCRSNGYTQIKYYGKDGEYACVQFFTVNSNDGSKKITIAPHEWGKPAFWYRNGQYSEMGREPIKDGITWVDKNTTKGVWMNRHDVWKRIELPKPLLDYILNYCRITKADSKEIQSMMKQYLMK